MKPAILSPLEAGTVFRSSKLEEFESRVHSCFEDDVELQLLLARIVDESSRLEEISRCQEVAYFSPCLILQSDIAQLSAEITTSQFRPTFHPCRRRLNRPGGQMESMTKLELKSNALTVVNRPL